jgi:hypothetical protein
MNQRYRAVLAFVCVAIVSLANQASGQTLTISRSSNNSALVTYHGISLDQCWAGPSTDSVTITSASIVIATTLSGSLCFPEPPIGPPFILTVDVGLLPDGIYQVSWSFIPAIYPPASASLELETGASAQPIPAMSTGAVVLLGIACASIGLLAVLRRRSR